MATPCPRVVIAGTNSGVGKTSVTLAVVSALRKRGLRVQAFKVGPDYLDPTYLSMASGRPCYNLDGWMTGKEYVTGLFAEKASQADIAVIEGVMGLFDGSDPVTSQGSTAEIAAWLDAPVILVVNVHGIARSIAAVVKGYASLEPSVKIAGVVANHCGTERHGAWLSESLGAFDLPGLVASLPRGVFPELPSRHLGLVSADARIVSDQVLDALSHAMERYGSMEQILEIAASAPALRDAQPLFSRHRKAATVRLGIALDEAFHFYYPDNLEALAAAGCELVQFSPCRDTSLPEGLHGIYLGGGYPEEFARELSENRTMVESIRRFAEAGKPLYAECGGLMYLSQGIESRSGERVRLVGLLPLWTRMLDRLKSLGYVEATLVNDSLFGKQGAQLRGHEFHYSELVGDPPQDSPWTAAYRIRHRRAQSDLTEGFQSGSVLASYVHAHFGSRPDAVEHFVAACREAANQDG